MRRLSPAGVAAALLLGLGVGGLPLPVCAQGAEPGGGGTAGGSAAAADGPAGGSPADTVPRDSVQRLRESLERPPGTPPFDGIDALTLPFRVAVLPLELVEEVLEELFDLITGPPPPSPIVRAYRDVRDWGLHFGVTSLGPRSGPALEARVVRFRPLFLESAYSIREFQLHRAGLRADGRTAAGELAFEFERQAEASFWGLGPWSPPGRRSDFLWDRVGGRVSGALWPAWWLELRAGGGYEENRVGPGRDSDSPDLAQVFDPAVLFGADERTRFWRASFGARLDLTRPAGFQRRGAVLEARATAFRGAGGTDAEFHRLRAGAEAHLGLNPRQLLLLRGVVEVNRPDAGRGVPFTHTATLGGSWGGRGYTDGRFRDRDLVAVSAEWRYEVWRELQRQVRLEGVVFVDQGVVERRLGEIESHDWAASGGVGLRLVSPGGFAGQGHLAVGEEGARFDVQVETSP